MKRHVLVSLCACALLFLAGAALAALPTMDAVKAFLPKMDGWTSEDPTGMQGASLVLVEQRFEKNEETNLSLLITMGDDANHAPMFDAYNEQKIDRIETGDGYVAFVKIGNFRAMEQLEKSSKTAVVWVDLGNTAWLGATGEGMTVEEVRAVVGRMDLAGLAALAPAVVK